MGWGCRRATSSPALVPPHCLGCRVGAPALSTEQQKAESPNALSTAGSLGLGCARPPTQRPPPAPGGGSGQQPCSVRCPGGHTATGTFEPPNLALLGSWGQSHGERAAQLGHEASIRSALCPVMFGREGFLCLHSHIHVTTPAFITETSYKEGSSP